MFKILELLDMSDLAQKLQHVSFSEASHLPEPSTADEPVAGILDRFEGLMQKSMALDVQGPGTFIPSTGSEAKLMSSACYAQASTVKRGSELRINIDKLAGFDLSSPLYPLRWLSRLSSVGSTSSDTAEHGAEEEEFLKDFDNAVLVRWIAHFPNVVANCLRNSEPALIMSYVQNIISQLSDSYEEDEEITASGPEHARFLACIGVVVSNALRLLKIIQYVIVHSMMFRPLTWRRNRTRDSGVFI